MDLLQMEHHEISTETGIAYGPKTCYILNIVSHSILLLNAIFLYVVTHKAYVHESPYNVHCGCTKHRIELLHNAAICLEL